MIRAVDREHEQAGSRDALTEYLAAHDAECPLCRYNLRGLHGNRCPECGHELALQVALTDPVRGAYLAGAIGLACAFGFNGLLFTLMLILGFTFGFGGGPPFGFWLYLFLATGVSALLLHWWSRNSLTIRRQSAQRRTLLALLCWGVPLGSLIITAVAATSF